MTSNNRFILILAILFLFICNTSQAQVAIGTGSPTPDATSMLDVQSNSKGILVPRMIQSERAGIVSPATGLLVYQTDGTSGFYYNAGTPGAPNWTLIVSGSGGSRWDLLTNPTAHLALAHGIDTTAFSFNGVTSKNAFTITSNSLTSGALMYLRGTSTAGSGYSTMLNIFKGGANTNSNVLSAGISTTVANTGTNSSNYGGDFFASGGNSNVGVSGTANGKDGIGVWGSNYSSNASTQIGVFGSKYGNTITGTGMGVQGLATGTGTVNKGGDFYATGADVNYGVYSYTDANNGYGIYGNDNSTTTGFHQAIAGVKSGNMGTGTGTAISGQAFGTASANYGGNFSADGATVNYGVYATTNGTGYGVYGGNFSNSPGVQMGVNGIKAGNTGTGSGTGVKGSATGTAFTNYGGEFSADGADNNYGVFGQTGTNNSYGIYGLNYSTGTGYQRAIAGFKTGNTGTGTGAGVIGTASGTGNTNYGGNFLASGATMNFGVYSVTNSNGFAVYGNNASTDPGSQVGIFGLKTGNTGAAASGTGVSGSATGTAAANIGGEFWASGGNSNYGVRSTTDANSGIGVYGANSSTGAGTQIGVWGEKTNNTTGAGYGVYGTAFGTGTSNVGGSFTASGATNNTGAQGVVIANTGAGLVGTNSSTATGTQYGVRGRKLGAMGSGTGYAVRGEASGTAAQNYGGSFIADGATESYGVSGQASGIGENFGGDFYTTGGTFNMAINALTTGHGTAVTATNTAGGTGSEYGLYATKSGNLSSGNGYAVYGTASGTATRNIGGYFSAAGATNNYAAIFDQGNVGIGTPVPTHKLEVIGSMTGDAVSLVQNTQGGGTADGIYISAGSNATNGAYFLYFKRPDGTSIGRVEQTTAGGVTYNTTSDERLKNIIGETGKGLTDLMKIRIYDYTFKTDEAKAIRSGFMAQELYNIFPQAVSKPRTNGAPEKDPWMVDYGSMTPLIIKAVQDQQLQMQKQEAEMESLRAQVKDAAAIIKAMAEKLAALEQR